MRKGQTFQLNTFPNVSIDSKSSMNLKVQLDLQNPIYSKNMQQFLKIRIGFLKQNQKLFTEFSESIKSKSFDKTVFRCLQKNIPDLDLANYKS